MNKIFNVYNLIIIMTIQFLIYNFVSTGLGAILFFVEIAYIVFWFLLCIVFRIKLEPKAAIK